MKLIAFLLVLGLSQFHAPKAQSGEVVIGAVVGISLSTAISISVLDYQSRNSSPYPYRTDLAQDAMDALALQTSDAISESLSQVIASVRLERPATAGLTDLEILAGLMINEAE